MVVEVDDDLVGTSFGSEDDKGPARWLRSTGLVRTCLSGSSRPTSWKVQFLWPRVDLLTIAVMSAISEAVRGSRGWRWAAETKEVR